MKKDVFPLNKPLINAALLGLAHLCICVAGAGYEGIRVPYLFAMTFLPGILFPLATSYYRYPTGPKRNKHLALSVAVYILATLLYCAGADSSFAQFCAGFGGSFLYLIISQEVLDMDFEIPPMMVVAVLSGLAFAPRTIYYLPEGMQTGLTLIIWHLLNGALINSDYGRYLRQSESVTGPCEKEI